MNDKFDELAKNMAQSVTRRGALKKFGVGLAGAVLASLGLNALACRPAHQRSASDCRDWMAANCRWRSFEGSVSCWCSPILTADRVRCGRRNWRNSITSTKRFLW